MKKDRARTYFHAVHYPHHYNYPHLVTNGSTYLDWVEIGNVIETENGGNYTFVYGPGKDSNTIFNGKAMSMLLCA